MFSSVSDQGPPASVVGAVLAAAGVVAEAFVVAGRGALAVVAEAAHGVVEAPAAVREVLAVVVAVCVLAQPVVADAEFANLFFLVAQLLPLLLLLLFM